MKLSNHNISEYIINTYKSFDFYVKKKNLKINPLAKKHEIETIILEKLKYLACVQFRYMEIIEDYSYDSRFQILHTFFSQDIFKDDINFSDHNIDQQILTLFSRHGIQSLTKLQCVDELKNAKIEIDDLSFKLSNDVFLNKILKYFNSKLTFIHSLNGSWHEYLLVESIPFKNFHHIFMITKEVCVFPSVNLTLAAITLDQNIFLRQTCFDYIYTHKWKHFYKTPPHSYLNAPEYKISNIFQKLAVEGINSNEEEIYKKSISNQIIENVFYHENGHFIINKTFDLESIAFMKKLKLTSNYFFESLDELYADCSPASKSVCGPLINIANLYEKKPALALRTLFTYASDTWFFDTNDTTMYEYSEMIHLLFISYLNPTKKSLRVNKMRTDTDLENPNSLLTKLVTTNNSRVKEIKQFLRQQKYKIAGKDEGFSTLDNFTRNLLKEKNPTLDVFSYKYNCIYWANIFLFVNKYLVNKKEFETLLDESKNKIYSILFAQTTKKPLLPKHARKYIMARYKKILPHYINENIFEAST